MDGAKEFGNASLAKEWGIAITTGRLAIGFRFPREIELAVKHSVSRSVIREATRTLVGKGLVSSRRKAGTFVSSRAHWILSDVDILEWMFEGELSDGFINDLHDVRLIVEPAAAAFAAKRRDETDLSAMRRSLVAIANSEGTADTQIAALAKFHASVVRASHNQLLVGLAPTVRAAVRGVAIQRSRSWTGSAHILNHFHALMTAIDGRDSIAAEAAATALVQAAKARANEDQKTSQA